MKATIISSTTFAALAIAAPTIINRNVNSTAKTLPSVYYVDGQRIDSRGGPAAVKSLCTVDDDVYTCAQKTAASWTVPPTYASADVISVTIPATLHWNVTDVPSYQQDTSAELSFRYKTGLSNCHLSNPQIVDHQDLFDCNDNGGCKQTFTFSSTTTSMTSEGWHIGATLQAGFNIGFASASVSVTGDTMASWSNTTTYTNTVSREYDLNAGDVCAPTTIQFETQCQQQMIVYPGVNEVMVSTQDPYGKTQDISLPICVPDGDLTKVQTGYPLITSLKVQDQYAAMYAAMCQAITQPLGLAVDVANFDGKNSWAIQGCMAS